MLLNGLIYLESNMMRGNIVVMIFVTEKNFVVLKDLRKYHFTRHIMIEKIHGNFVLLSNKHIMLVYAFFVTMMSRTRIVSVYYYYIMYVLLHFCIIKYSILISFLIILLINRPFIIKIFSFRNRFGALCAYNINYLYRNVCIAI